jgi:sugar phosphate isomerase/epimerase
LADLILEGELTMSHHHRPSRRRFLGASILACMARSGRAVGPAAEAAAPGPWQLGCYTRPWDQFDYRVALDGIAEAGFPYVGIMTHKGKTWVVITPRTTHQEAEQIAAEVRKRGLKTISVFGDFGVGESPARAIEDLRRLIEHCAACGSPNLLLGGTTDASQYAAYYHAIAGCCDFAAAHGVGLSIKPHGGQNATGPQCRQAIDRVGHPNFRLWYDPGNIFYYSQGNRDPVDDSATVDGLVVGMSVKDFRPPNDVMLTPGTGRVDFKKVLDRLQKGGFTTGPLVVECLAGGDVKQITAEARKALGLLRELTAMKP